MSTDRIAVFGKMKQIIVEQLDVKDADVHEGAAFIEDLGADSLALVELVLALEERFAITIPDTEADKLRTVGDAVTFVIQHPGSAKGQHAGAA